MKDCHTTIPLFLRCYSDYLGADSNIKNLGQEATPSMFEEYRYRLDKLITELIAIRADNKADGYLLYLLGVVSVKLERYDLAVETLLESIHKEPLNWQAWLHLGDLIVDRVKVSETSYIKDKIFNLWLIN